MLNDNQTKAASELLVTVHEMMQRPEEHKTPELLLESIEAHIRDTESITRQTSKTTQNGKNAWQARRQRNRQSKVIKDGKKEAKKDEEVPVDDGSYRDDKVVQQAALNGAMVTAGITLVPTKTIDGRKDDADDNTYRNEGDFVITAKGDCSEDDHSEIEAKGDCTEDDHTEWGDYTRKSESSLYSTTDYQDESEPEIEGLTLYPDFLSEEVVSEESESESEYGEDEYDSDTSVCIDGDKIIEENVTWESETEDGSSDDGYTTGTTVYVDGDKSSTIGYVSNDITDDEDDDDDDDEEDDDEILTCVLSERDRVILYLIENDLHQLQDIHEQEKEGWLYQTFYPEE